MTGKATLAALLAQLLVGKPVEAPAPPKEPRRVFVAPLLEDQGLKRAAESFLDALLVRRSPDDALKLLGHGIEDGALVPPSSYLDDMDEWYKLGPLIAAGKPVPLPRAAVERYWRSFFAELPRVRDQEAPRARPRSLDAALARLDPSAGLARELASGGESGRPLTVSPLGDRLLTFQVRGWKDLEFVRAHGEGDYPPGYETLLDARLRSGRLDMRAVVAVQRVAWPAAGSEPETEFSQELVMLWAREPGGWRLWGLTESQRDLLEKDEQQP